MSHSLFPPDPSSPRGNQIIKVKIVDKEKFNWGQFISNLLTAMAVGITLYTVALTKKATDATVKAANAADASLQQQIIDRQEAAKEADEQHALDSAVTAKRFHFDSLSIHNQLEELNESRLQFEKANRPFIEALDIAVDSFEVGQRLKINFVIVNSGRLPGRITYFEYNMLVWWTDSSKESVINAFGPPNPRNYQRVLAGLTNQTASLYYNDPLTPATVEALKNHQLSIYFLCKIKYQGTSTPTIGNFDILYRMRVYPTFNIDMLSYVSQ